MIYDLNINWAPSTTASALEVTLRQAAILGYDVVAINHTINKLPIPSPITNPLPLVPESKTLPTVLRRATVQYADPRDNHRLDAVAAAFDILAVRPMNEVAFNHACVNLAEPSILTLDLAANLGFYFRPKSVMAAVRRGVRIEICYTQGIGARDSRARALFVANLVGLFRASKGRGLIVSSGAAAGSPRLLRAPADVVNLLAVWGMGTERGLDTLSGNPRGVVVNEGIKRSAFRGVIDVVHGAGALDCHGKGSDAAGTVAGEKKENQGGNKEKGLKRKNGEQTGAGDDQKLSKRQAKKQKQQSQVAKQGEGAGQG
ncbi:hypothetical protein MCOR29_008592 [Pyricularia oryzae]|nr:hypothetical protein MCOR19_008918 [Pyricularia oryzae]KAI6310522.1 hypothetical protein MCOR29_008592 [Pyricularia oryzae]KAI6314847.1 hypothetical protein MCOR30_009835 [Pyricularia oryzae]KAI6362678.1 hypothetical protein MCOR31_008132 [Pyricularia oryzae]KAI6410163.1 hypothetical protein MCOR24_007153 [Pyricularia oryzae]